jgi:hypothetical protein
LQLVFFYGCLISGHLLIEVSGYYQIIQVTATNSQMSNSTVPTHRLAEKVGTFSASLMAMGTGEENKSFSPPNDDTDWVGYPVWAD